MRIVSNPAIQQAFQSGGIASPTPAPNGTGAAAPAGDFGEMLTQALKDVNASQAEARTQQEDFMTGRKPVEIHDVMIAMEQASTAMQLTMAVRNKMLEAYAEINRMQV